MSKHVDLIAVGALLLAFGAAARVHEVWRAGVSQVRFYSVRPMGPVIVAPPRVPAVPRLPRVQY